jgi:predicted NAD/FAD-dependent oxidoreductase
MASLWPTDVPATALLATADGSAGGTIDDQHVQANYEGSDRYTVALPGSLEFRISPLDRFIANMTIAGDWTECGFNEGCIEAAVMSGMLAAHAISGKPELHDIVAYDHP